MIFCAPAAIYFGVKFNLPTPSVYLLPAKLLCCYGEKRARALQLVLLLTLWFDLVSTFILVSHGIAFLNAFPVAPFAVAVNLMLLVLTSTCLTYIMALIFMICAFVGTRRCLSNSADCLAKVRAAMLIPLPFTVICFSLFVFWIGQFVNITTQQSSFHMILKSLLLLLFCLLWAWVWRGSFQYGCTGHLVVRRMKVRRQTHCRGMITKNTKCWIKCKVCQFSVQVCFVVLELIVVWTS